MAHGAGIKAAYTPHRVARVGDTVAFYQMTSAAAPGPHEAVVVRIGRYATRLDLKVGDLIIDNVDHRSATDTGRLWDWK